MAGDLLGELYEVVAFLHGGGVGVSGLGGMTLTTRLEVAGDVDSI